MPLILSCVTDSPTAQRVVRASSLFGRALSLPIRFVQFIAPGDNRPGRLGDLVAQEMDGANSLETVQVRRRAADAICSLAGKDRADYIIMGALARERAVRDVVGSTARRVARRAPCSVVLISTAGRDAREWSRFIVGVDYSAPSAELATVMLRLARDGARNSTVCFAREHLGFEPESALASELDPYIDESVRQAAEQHPLASFIDALDTRGVAASAVTLPGRPGQEIARYAEDSRADLLGVLAPARPLGALDRLMSHPLILLLDRLPCSVLLYRPAAGLAADKKEQR